MKGRLNCIIVVFIAFQSILLNLLEASFKTKQNKNPKHKQEEENKTKPQTVTEFMQESECI